MHRAIVAVLVAVTALIGPAGGQAAPAPSLLRPSLQVGEKAWVAVSVTTLWRTPDSPHAVDAPALARPAGITRWLADMTTEQRRSLGGRADTQALLGDQVLVVQLQGDWAKVVVPSQPSQLDARGYPGWVPQRQLTANPPVREPKTATVVRRTALLKTDGATARRVFPISFGTRLPVVEATSRFVRVRTPPGAVRRIAADAVVVRDPGEPAVALSRTSMVRTARSFVGLPYLWSGLSGFGLDCSGLTWLVGRPLIALNGERYAREAEFRFALVRVNESGESIALHGGEKDEHRHLEAALAAVVDTMRRISSSLAQLTWITSGTGWLRWN